MDDNQKPPSKRFLSKKLLLPDTSWHEQNFIPVKKHMQTSTTEHCQDRLLSFCIFNRHKNEDNVIFKTAFTISSILQSAFSQPKRLVIGLVECLDLLGT